MITGISSVFSPSNQKTSENQNQQAKPNAEEQEQSQAVPAQSNSGSSQNSNSSGAVQAQPAVNSSQAANTSKSVQPASASQAIASEKAEKSSFNDSAYTRRVAERVQAEMNMGSVLNMKTQSSALPSLFAAESKEIGSTNKAVLSEYMKNSEPA